MAHCYESHVLIGDPIDGTNDGRAVCPKDWVTWAQRTQFQVAITMDHLKMEGKLINHEVTSNLASPTLRLHFCALDRMSQSFIV